VIVLKDLQKYFFLMIVLALGVVGISSSISGMVGVYHPELIKISLIICNLIGIMGISIFHFTKGRNIKFK
jgi:hypothetical protein